MSSKFSSPFFKKSPLYGAYTSGADAMVTVSTAPHFAKLQSDISGAVDKYYTGKKDSCSNLDKKLSENKISNAAHATLTKKCAKSNEVGTGEALDNAIDSGITTEQMDKVFKAGSLINSF